MSRSRSKRLLFTVSLMVLGVAAVVAAQTVPGYTVTTFANVTGPRGVSTDAAGNVYTMGRDTGLVYKISPTGVATSSRKPGGRSPCGAPLRARVW